MIIGKSNLETDILLIIYNLISEDITAVININIACLHDYPDFVPIITEWHLRQWNHIPPIYTHDSYKQYLLSHYKRNCIPTMFVAVSNNKVIGTAALEDYDMDTHRDLSPWLASVYVDKNHRRKGVGRTLVRHVIEQAHITGTKKLYLFTPDHASFYEHFGWTVLFKEKYYGEWENIMALAISDIENDR